MQVGIGGDIKVFSTDYDDILMFVSFEDADKDSALKELL